MAIDKEEFEARKEALEERGKEVSLKKAEVSLKRTEFEQWKKSPAGAPLKFGEMVGARFLSSGKLRAIPKIRRESLGGMKKFGRDIERKKAQWYFSR